MREKYATIGRQYLLPPIAVETLGPMNTSAFLLFANLERKISSTSGDDREGAFLFQSFGAGAVLQRCIVT